MKLTCRPLKDHQESTIWHYSLQCLQWQCVDNKQDTWLSIDQHTLQWKCLVQKDALLVSGLSLLSENVDMHKRPENLLSAWDKSIVHDPSMRMIFAISLQRYNTALDYTKQTDKQKKQDTLSKWEHIIIQYVRSSIANNNQSFNGSLTSLCSRPHQRDILHVIPEQLWTLSVLC